MRGGSSEAEERDAGGPFRAPAWPTEALRERRRAASFRRVQERTQRALARERARRRRVRGAAIFAFAFAAGLGGLVFVLALVGVVESWLLFPVAVGLACGALWLRFVHASRA